MPITRNVWFTLWSNGLSRLKYTAHFASALSLAAPLAACSDDGVADAEDSAGTDSGGESSGTTGSDAGSSSSSSTGPSTSSTSGGTTGSDSTATTGTDTSSATDDGGDDGSQLPIPRMWEIEGFNWLLVVEGDEFYILEHTPVSCLLSVIPGMPLAGPLGLLPLLVELPEDFSPTETTDFVAQFPHDRTATQARYLEQPPESCRDGLTLDVFHPDYEPDPLLDFDIFWHSFAQNYAFMDLYGVDWDDTRDKFRKQVDADTSDDQLAEIFKAMIQPLDDGHVTLMRFEDDGLLVGDKIEIWSPEGPFVHLQRLKQEFDEQTEVDDFEVFSEQAFTRVQEIMLDTYLGNGIKKAADGRVQWTTLQSAENIGYIAIHQMSDYSDSGLAKTDVAAADSIMEQVLTDLSGVDGIIIDVRENTGGYDAVSLKIAEHFTRERTYVYSKQSYEDGELSDKRDAYVEPSPGTVFAGPVALLLSDKTASAAEIFSMTMKQLPQVRAIGDASNGALSDAMVRRLTNRLAMSLSHQVYTDADGEIPEGKGIQPDVLAPYMLAADRQAGIDGAMEAAIAFIRE